MAIVRRTSRGSRTSKNQKHKRISTIRLGCKTEEQPKPTGVIRISSEQRALMALEYPHLYSAPAKDLLRVAAGVSFDD